MILKKIMDNTKYFISLIFLIFLIITPIICNSNIKFLTKKRNLSEDSSSIKQEKTIIIQEQPDNQDEINYQIYKELKKLENEENKRKLERSKEQIKLTKKRWENHHQMKEILKYRNNKLIIPCAYALDNSYVYPTLVAMNSLAHNAGNNTFYSIYVLIGDDFSEENKKVIKSVEKNYTAHCEINFILMGNKFKDEKTDERIKTPAYYRLELPALLPEIDRIIWMDGDTAVFEDLTPLMKLDMKGNYIMGFLDALPDAIDKFGIVNGTVLCSGVLLMDLNALRRDKMMEKFFKFMVEKKEEINQHDQTVINVVCQGKIAPLPPKYGIWCFEHEKYLLKYNERQRPNLRYNQEELINAYYHPAILHYVWPKPYWKRPKPIFNKEWWDYAKSSGYYLDVYNKSPKYVKWGKPK